jgi:excisionase family DNA binding protein
MYDSCHAILNLLLFCPGDLPMPPVVVEKSFCTTREASALLGVSVGTVQLWVENGLLQAWKTAGGHRRVMRESVERLLRKAPESPAPLQPGAQADAEPRTLRVLVVDDDLALLRLYQAKLSRWPMQPQVTCLDNAVSALMLLGRGGPDLLVTDLHMPGMDGFTMIRLLKTAPEVQHTKIVVVTGLDAGAIADQGGLPEGIEVLGKPIPFDRLLSAANAIVNQSSFQIK